LATANWGPVEDIILQWEEEEEKREREEEEEKEGGRRELGDEGGELE